MSMFNCLNSLLKLIKLDSVHRYYTGFREMSREKRRKKGEKEGGTDNRKERRIREWGEKRGKIKEEKWEVFDFSSSQQKRMGEKRR